MNQSDDDALLRRQRRFLEEVERDIRAINREVLHERVPDLGRQCFVDLSRIVARKRTDYLCLTLNLSRCTPGSEDEKRTLAMLTESRREYVEAREAFSALERSIEQGYIDIGTR